MKRGEEFEQLVASIAQAVAPGCDVEHNVFVVGRTRRRRQVDIALRAQVGFQKVFIAVECKDYSRAVGLREVEAFVTKLRDISASAGVLVARAGFTKGAIACAQQNDISLLDYEAATQANWARLISSESWARFYLARMHLCCAYAQPDRDTCIRIQAADLAAPTAAGVSKSLKDLIIEHMSAAVGQAPPSWIAMPISLDSEIQISSGSHRISTDQVFARALITLAEYALPMGFDSGHRLTSKAPAESNSFTVLNSTAVNWRELCRGRPSRLVGTDELPQLLASGGLAGTIDASELKPWIRLRITERPRERPASGDHL